MRQSRLNRYIVWKSGMKRLRCWRTGLLPCVRHGLATRKARWKPAYTRFFLSRRERVCALTRPAEGHHSGEQTAQAPGSEARLGRRERPERRQRRAAGSAPSGGDPEAGAPAPDRREGGERPGGEPQRRLSVRFAEEADACGALGCTETSGLLAVEDDGDRRVLCPKHARRWSDR